jgi:alanine-alpha-ketoisovalerate/valine-pyruvate aminotransferase
MGGIYTEEEMRRLDRQRVHHDVPGLITDRSGEMGPALSWGYQQS